MHTDAIIGLLLAFCLIASACFHLIKILTEDQSWILCNVSQIHCICFSLLPHRIISLLNKIVLISSVPSLGPSPTQYHAETQVSGRQSAHSHLHHHLESSRVGQGEVVQLAGADRQRALERGYIVLIVRF